MCPSVDALPPPIFILGSPRSGTTLLRLMLTCHPSIVIPPEGGFAVWLWPHYQAWPSQPERDFLVHFARNVLACRKMETWGLSEETLLGALLAESPARYADAVDATYRCYARERARPFRRWGDKNNFYLEHIATLDRLFPAAHFVHIVRDGRNVACSYRQLALMRLASPYAPRLPSAIEEIARQWRDNVETIRRGLASLRRERVSELRFEDLTHRPEYELRHLCGALGEDYAPEMLDFYQRNSRDTLEPSDFLAWKGKTVQPLQAEEPELYRSRLAPAEIRAFESIAGDTLQAYDFA